MTEKLPRAESDRIISKKLIQIITSEGGVNQSNIAKKYNDNLDKDSRADWSNYNDRMRMINLVRRHLKKLEEENKVKGDISFKNRGGLGEKIYQVKAK